MLKIFGYIIAFFIILSVFLPFGTTKEKIIKPKDKIVLVWDKNLSYTLGSADYANVISAPFYALENIDGKMYMKELHDTEKYLKNIDKPVWGMFTNGFNPDNTHLFITDNKKRTEIIDSIVSTSVKYNLQGVNIDFENMYSEDAHHFTAFIKELSEKLHSKGKNLSVDVTKINEGSKFYSMCYDRKELSKYADYIILMAYDQYSRTSTVAGPVASIPWTEEAIKGLLSEVPAEKLILGIPFYTRKWIEKDGVVINCPAISMDESEALKNTHSADVVDDTETGLQYFQFQTEEGLNKIWQENKKSIQKRCELTKKYNLGGIACWSLGFESEEVKTEIKKQV